MKVLMVGNDPSVKGGITSVIGQLLSYDWSKHNVEMMFVPTYVEGNNIKKVAFFSKAYLRIERELKNHRPDVVHIHMSYKGSFVRKFAIHKLCKKYSIPDIIHLHGSEFQKWYDGTTASQKKQIKTLLKECDAFVVLGEKWNKVVKTIEPDTNTVVVYNTVSIPNVSTYWMQPFKILYLGVLIKRKGVSDLLKAISLLSSEVSSNKVQFIIAGNGEEEETLRKQCKDLEITNLVSFLGWVDGERKIKLLSECQMFVLPSYNEGLPVSILEAISYGMPVVSTDVGDISSAVHDGENGYLVLPGDVETLKDRLLKLINNRDLFEDMSQKSKLIATTSFSDTNYYDTILELYEECVLNGRK